MHTQIMHTQIKDSCTVGSPLSLGITCGIECQAGYLQNDAGTYEYTCIKASKLRPANPDCQACPPNTFKQAPGRGKCAPCPMYCSTNNTGQAACTCKSAPIATGWILVCIIATTCGILSLAISIPSAKRTLNSLRRIQLPEDDNYQGLGGCCLFLWGVVDLVLSVNVCLCLLNCGGAVEGHWFLFGSFLGTLVATWTATVHLSWHTLGVIRAGRADPLLGPRLEVGSDISGGYTNQIASVQSSVSKCGLQHDYRRILTGSTVLRLCLIAQLVPAATPPSRPPLN